MNTIENNKLIAEFIGAYPVEQSEPEEFWYLIDGNFPHGYDTIHFGAMQFNTSFDWLMTLVEKIESLGHWTELVGGQHHEFRIGDLNVSQPFISCDDEVKIKAVYQGVVRFIKWYNSAQKEE